MKTQSIHVWGRAIESDLTRHGHARYNPEGYGPTEIKARNREARERAQAALKEIKYPKREPLHRWARSHNGHHGAAPFAVFFARKVRDRAFLLPAKAEQR